MANRLEKLQQVLNYRFTDPSLAQLALTHRSANAVHNERLEFLGDSLLGFIVAEALHRLHEEASEGELTIMRASLVSKPALAAVARRLGISNYLQLSSGELKSGGSDRDSILSDAMEALIAAIYLDGGMEPCKEFVASMHQAELEGGAAKKRKQKDAKTRLQEFAQARSWPLPKYKVIDITGAAHEQLFHVSCSLEGSGVDAEGSGPSKRIAQQQAAEKILQMMEEIENSA